MTRESDEFQRVAGAIREASLALLYRSPHDVIEALDLARGAAVAYHKESSKASPRRLRQSLEQLARARAAEFR